MTNFPGKQKILFWQERKRLKQEIRRAIIGAMTLAKNPKDRVTIERFIDVIEPGTLYDTARFPYRANRHENAYFPSKIHCVFALINILLCDYWDFIATEDANRTQCRASIARLGSVCDNYETLTVHGDLTKGYWLE